MAAAIEVAGDVAAAGSALAGLILVYMGAVAASFDSFEPQERKTVGPRHRGRAWFAFVGLILCLGSVGLALFAKWLAIECMAASALFILAIALAWVVGTALMTVRDMK